jgi:hypothetical protein
MTVCPQEFAPQSLGFWVSEGFAPGLALAGCAPAQRDDLPAHVHEVQAHCWCPGALLRWLRPADVADAP